MDSDPLTLVDSSGRLLDAVRRADDTTALRGRLASVSDESLLALEEDAAKAFWLNLYNAVAQSALREDPTRWSNKRRFFGEERVTVAGQQLSLDDIEHGILRQSHSKYGFGYLPRLFPSDFERRHRLSTVDPRIHFALNCGAASCPAIAPHSASSLNSELDADTRTFLEQSSTRGDGVVYVSRLFLYYRGDFGGRRGIYQFLERHGILEAGERPRVKYSAYDWSLELEQFRFRSEDGP